MFTPWYMTSLFKTRCGKPSSVLTTARYINARTYEGTRRCTYDVYYGSGGSAPSWECKQTPETHSRTLGSCAHGVSIGSASARAWRATTRMT
eukprot:1194447-Prorocentrum_minimum.AAC.5